ncbi:MAG: Gfo/Idh/MocA family protein [Bdellovibrionota bacterium]
MVKIGIMGCGLIGKKRLLALDPKQVGVVCDLDPGRAKALAQGLPQCEAMSDPEKAIATSDVDLWIIATANVSLAPLTLAAVKLGKHVLVEKPGAVRSSELEDIRKVAERTGALVRIGFNHRFHPAMQKAFDIVKSGGIGPLMFLRGRYGHGGRVGYEKEWRADPKLSGGGELMDQGVHLIDLATWYMGPYETVEGHAATYFWKMPVDDNGFISLRSATGQTAWLQVSCTEWKNLFSLEIYGKTGKLHIEGIGGSYGIERLYHYQMLPEMGPPDTVIHEFPRGDGSWALELKIFLKEIAEGVRSTALDDGIRTLQAVEKIYASSGYEF